MNEQDVGANIRMWRERLRLTLTVLAESAGMTKSTLSKIETGQISSPISTLMRIAKALDVPLAEFFVNPRPELPYVFTPKGDGEVISRGGTKFGYTYEGLALPKTGKLAEPVLLTIHPGDPLVEFCHGGQEFIYMLSGVVEFSVGDQVFRMKAGDSLYYDSNIKHTTQIVGEETVRFLCVYMGLEKQGQASEKYRFKGRAKSSAGNS